jgi:Gnt-I system low-affinity gluconate transporter
MTFSLLMAAIGIAILLFLVLRQKMPAFLALILVSLIVGLMTGMEPMSVIESVKNGMGGTLGFVAVVVGLGAMFGALLEHAGGLEAISSRLLGRFSEDRAGWALGLVGFLVAIPVFFDVAFIMLVPLIQQLSRKTGKALLTYALPLLAGLAVTHAFIPPTPGPIAVAELLSADLGLVIFFGFIAGIPALILGGPVLARFYKNTPALTGEPIFAAPSGEPSIGFGHAVFAVAMPLVLILLATFQQIDPASLNQDSGFGRSMSLLIVENAGWQSFFQFIGHPFTALSIACVYVYVAFGLMRRVPRETIGQIMTKSLEPAGVVVLITGAGGVFKQVLIDSGVGQDLAAAVSATGMPVVLFAFIVAFLVRIAQGSATVAMITAAGLAAPVATVAGLSPVDTALAVIAIASGASMTSHVNDSGFWRGNQYLGQTPRETLRSWTVATSVIGLTGLAVTLILSVLF